MQEGNSLQVHDIVGLYDTKVKGNLQLRSLQRRRPPVHTGVIQW
jgi:hypothetical protein